MKILGLRLVLKNGFRMIGEYTIEIEVSINKSEESLLEQDRT